MGFLASIQMSDELVAEFIRIVYHGNKHFSDSESREQKTDIRGQRAEVGDQRPETRHQRFVFRMKDSGAFIMEPNIRPTSLFIEINSLCVSLSIY